MSQTFIVSTNDGTTRFASLLEDAIAQVLLDMEGDVTVMIVNMAEINVSKVFYDGDSESGLLFDNKTQPKMTSVKIDFTPAQIEAVLQLCKLKEGEMRIRDILMNSITDILDPPKEEGREDCPVLTAQCDYYSYQCDDNGDVAICHCSHPDNPEDTEGNCLHTLCPLNPPSDEYS